MRWSRVAIPALIVLIVCASGTSESAHAQEPSKKEDGAGRADIAVIDVAYLLKNHMRLKALLETLHQDTQEARRKLREEVKKIGILRERLSAYKPQSSEYRELEEDLLRQVSRIDAERMLLTRQLRQRQAKIYESVYEEIQQMATRFCERHALGAVLNASSQSANRIELPTIDLDSHADMHATYRLSKSADSYSWTEPTAAGKYVRKQFPMPMDPDPVAIENRINQPVVAFLRERDITSDILEQMNPRPPNR